MRWAPPPNLRIYIAAAIGTACAMTLVEVRARSIVSESTRVVANLHLSRTLSEGITVERRRLLAQAAERRAPWLRRVAGPLRE